MQQLPGRPMKRPPLHKCRHPVLHTLLALSVAGGYLWCSWQVCFTLGALLRSWCLPVEVHPIVWSVFARWLLVWGLSILVDVGWLLFGIPIGTALAYTIVMDRCHRLLEHIASWEAEARQTQGQSQPSTHPVLVERVYLAEDDAQRRGFPGPVIVERVHYRNPQA